MIYFSIISRTTDGLALVANSDSPPLALHPGLEAAHRNLKLLSRVSAKFPDRCTLHCGAYVI